MAIHYDKAYNAKIAKAVKNFNEKRNRAIKRGFKDVPSPVRVSDLKARYTSRRELNKQLDILRQFSSAKKDLLKRIENQGGAKSTEWNWNYLQSNVKDAIEYYKREYETIAKRVGDFPGERMLLDNIADKIKTLQLDSAYMTQSQFDSYKATISYYLKMPQRMRSGYRGFLQEVELVMKRVGYDEKQVSSVFDRLKVLQPYQFHQLYEESDLIRRIYDLAESPKHGDQDIKLTTDEENAKEILDTFLEELDEDVAKYSKF